MQGKRAARQMELDADVNGRRWRKRERERARRLGREIRRNEICEGGGIDDGSPMMEKA